jgi:hypothetical protein
MTGRAHKRGHGTIYVADEKVCSFLVCQIIVCRETSADVICLCHPFRRRFSVSLPRAEEGIFSKADRAFVLAEKPPKQPFSGI